MIPLTRTTTCRTCGMRVMFVSTNEGTKVPLDVRAPVYTRVQDPETGKGFWLRDTTDESLADHRSTCRKKNQFSGFGRGRNGE